MSRILAIDYGYKRIGLAISDPLKIIASPLDTIAGSPDPKRAAKTLYEAYMVFQSQKGYVCSEVVVGLPLNMNGTESERSRAVRAFVAELEPLLLLPIHFFDERLSTVQAERVLKEVGFSRKKRSAFVDGVSAVIVLQTFLASRGSVK